MFPNINSLFYFQAVSAITKFVSQNSFADLKGLLTKPALTALQQDVETRWSDEQRRLVGLNPVDIQVAIPMKVRFRKTVGMFIITTTFIDTMFITLFDKKC